MLFLAAMLRQPATLLLVLGLVLTRLVGLHVHSCTGVELASHQHETPHLADGGFFFGEFHANDHQDNQESNLSAVQTASKFTVSEPDLVAPPPVDRLTVAQTSGWLTVQSARGPPATHPRSPEHFTPPLRGPPHSLA